MRRVLIVEDEMHLAEGLRFNLEAEGYEVAIASDGEGALKLLLPASKFDAGDPRVRKIKAVILLIPNRPEFTCGSLLVPAPASP